MARVSPPSARARDRRLEEVGVAALHQESERLRSRPIPQGVTNPRRISENLYEERVEEAEEFWVRRSARERPGELPVDRQIEAHHAVIREHDIPDAQVVGARAGQACEQERSRALRPFTGFASTAMNPGADLRQVPIWIAPSKRLHEPMATSIWGRRRAMTDEERSPARCDRRHRRAQAVGAAREENDAIGIAVQFVLWKLKRELALLGLGLREVELPSVVGNEAQSHLERRGGRPKLPEARVRDWNRQAHLTMPLPAVDVRFAASRNGLIGGVRVGGDLD